MRHFLNGIEIAPRNLEQIGVVADFNGNPDFLSISVDSLTLPREAVEIVNNHIAQVGIFEGIPYLIELEPNVSIEYYVDLLDGLIIKTHEVEVKLKRRKSIDNFYERAEGSSFALLAKNGVVFEQVDVPYFIIKDNQFETAIELAIIIFILAKETITAYQAIGQANTQLTEASVPIPVASIPPGLGYNLPAIIGAAINLVLAIIYFAALIITLFNFATKLGFLLFPPKRYINACLVTELLKKSCAHFGYNFESDLLTEAPNFAVLPVPIIKDRKSIWDILPEEVFPIFNNGYPDSMDTTPSVLKFIRGLEVMFNARTIVRGNEVRLERRDWLQEQTSLQILPAITLQTERQDSYTYNTEDVWKRYYIHYQTDFSDIHTVDGVTYDNHNTELSTEPSFPITNPDLVTIKGLNEVSIPFALGARKSELNWLEKIAKEMFALVDTFTSFIGGSSNFEQQILDRKDALMISQQYFSTTKMLYGKTGEIKPNELIQDENYFDEISATALWNKYHYINQIQIYDFIIRENIRIRISSEDFVSLLNNNYAFINGQVCEILKLEWLDEKSYASLTYKEPNNWAGGKVVTQVIN
tara:strand:+ start:1493 stop:3247 length:1755 start_codon:yes stop_codon:yes gene_type:complete